MSKFLERLRQERVVVVIRDAKTGILQQQLQALYAGGLRVFEVTVESPRAIDALASVEVPDDALIGVGTVLDSKTAVLAIAKGAQFVVSPVVLPEVCQVSRAHGTPCILGGMTPTEVYSAYQLGCEAVKVFPASGVGASFIRELQGPLGHIPLYPTGGINLENGEAFLQAGAVAIGVGSALVQRQWVQQQNWLALQTEAAHWAKFRLL